MLWTKLSYSQISRPKSVMASTDTVSATLPPCTPARSSTVLSDWAYLEDWCRRLTSSFADVYVFTIPLYLPKLESDGKWRVVRAKSLTLLGNS